MWCLRRLAVLAGQSKWFKEESGQDLVEYALVVALVAFGATAGTTSLASGIGSVFSIIAGTIGTYIT